MTTDHHHHDPDDDRHDPDHDRLRIRLYIGGKLQREEWLLADDPESPEIAHAAAGLHAKAVEAADSEGFTWCVEVWDPAAPPGSAYLRIGTDPTGMTDPRPLFGGQALVDGAS